MCEDIGNIGTHGNIVATISHGIGIKSYQPVILRQVPYRPLCVVKPEANEP